MSRVSQFLKQLGDGTELGGKYVSRLAFPLNFSIGRVELSTPHFFETKTLGNKREMEKPLFRRHFVVV